MAATEWKAATDLVGPEPQVVTAQSARGRILEGWAGQTLIAVARVPLTQWLFDELDYHWPGTTGRRWPTNR